MLHTIKNILRWVCMGAEESLNIWVLLCSQFIALFEWRFGLWEFKAFTITSRDSFEPGMLVNNLGLLQSTSFGGSDRSNSFADLRCSIHVISLGATVVVAPKFLLRGWASDLNRAIQLLICIITKCSWDINPFLASGRRWHRAIICHIVHTGSSDLRFLGMRTFFDHSKIYNFALKFCQLRFKLVCIWWGIVLITWAAGASSSSLFLGLVVLLHGFNVLVGQSNFSAINNLRGRRNSFAWFSVDHRSFSSLDNFRVEISKCVVQMIL